MLYLFGYVFNFMEVLPPTPILFERFTTTPKRNIFGRFLNATSVFGKLLREVRKTDVRVRFSVVITVISRPSILGRNRTKLDFLVLRFKSWISHLLRIKIWLQVNLRIVMVLVWTANGLEGYCV